MALREITLTATESNWRLFMVRKADPAFLNFQEKIFQRDQHTCQFCGFQSQLFQEVVNADGNYLNNRLNNLVTACSFCAQCFFLEAIGRSKFGGGTLVYLPEMSQGDVNALSHVLFTSMVTGNSYSTQSKNIYRSLRLRSQQIEQELGQGLSNPALLGQLIIDSNVGDIKQLQQDLAPKLRVLPDITRFATEIEAWIEDSLRAMHYV